MKKPKKILSVALAAIMASSILSFAAIPAAAVPATESTSFSWDNASVYFLLTDRFKNADTSNDNSYNRLLNKDGTDARSQTKSDVATFHGGDFKGVTETIKDGYFNDLGINALWITAPYEQTHGYSVATDDSPSFPHYAYHGYYVLDYTQPDANFGTAEEFKELVDTAHEYGLRVVLDVVMNHPGYNSLYDMDEYGFGTLKTTANGTWEDAYYSWGNITQKGGRYDYHQFIDYDSTTAENCAAWAKWWGKDWVRAGIADYTSTDGKDPLTESVSYLPDFKTESTKEVDIPEILRTKWTIEGTLDQHLAELDQWFESTGNPRTVRYYQVFWLSQWVREYGVDGFRCDTAKHVEIESWKALKDECTTALREWKAENPEKALDDLDFWMVGENWDSKQTLNYNEYFTSGAFDSMINFAYGNAKGLPKLENLNSTYKNYASTINETEYEQEFNMLTYISSHDDNIYRKTDIAYQASALMLMPGGIQVYYGDETNRPKIPRQSGVTLGDHAYRSDMNWDSIDEDLLTHWQKVGTFRNEHLSVGAGLHRAAESTSGSAFIRKYLEEGSEDVIAACITDEYNTDVTISVGAAFNEGSKVTNTYTGETAIVTNGKVTFNSGAYGTILIEGDDININPPANGYYGDVDGDEIVDIKDVVVLQKHIAEILTLTGDKFTAGDVVVDEVIDLKDVILVQKYAAEMDVPLVGEPIV